MLCVFGSSLLLLPPSSLCLPLLRRRYSLLDELVGRRHHRVDEPGYACDKGVYDEPFRQRGLRVETATRVDPEHGGEATCAWLVGVALRDDAERPMVQQ